jgi:hypothetical protein
MNQAQLPEWLTCQTTLEMIGQLLPQQTEALLEGIS